MGPRQPGMPTSHHRTIRTNINFNHANQVCQPATTAPYAPTSTSTTPTRYQKKPLITPQHPSFHQHTSPESPCIRKNPLSPLNTPHFTNTLHQNHPVSEKTPYHPSTPLISPTHFTRITLYQKKPLITPQLPSFHQHTSPESLNL